MSLKSRKLTYKNPMHRVLVYPLTPWYLLALTQKITTNLRIKQITHWTRFKLKKNKNRKGLEVYLAPKRTLASHQL